MITAATGEPAAGPGASQKPQVQDEGAFACRDQSGGTGGAQLTDDHISIGLLTKTYPPELVDAVVASTGRTQLRHRLLPARVVVYYVMALSLYSQASYEEVMQFLVQGLSWLTHWRKGWQVPTKAAIFKSRQRLGVEPMRELFRGHRAASGGIGDRGRPVSGLAGHGDRWQLPGRD